MSILSNIDPMAVVGIFAKLFPDIDLTKQVKQGLAEIKQAKNGTSNESEVVKKVLLNNKVTKTQLDKVAGYIEAFPTNKLPFVLKTAMSASVFNKRNIAKTIRSWGENNNNLNSEAPKLNIPKSNTKRTFSKI